MLSERLKELIAKAHPFPWLRSPGSGGAGNWFAIGEAHGDGVDNTVAEARGEANANLIAALSVVAPLLIEIAEDAELLYGAIDEAHAKGETFPARVSICGARLRRSLDALKAGKDD